MIDHLGRDKGVIAANKGQLQLSATGEVQYLVPQQPAELLLLAAAWQRMPLDWQTKADGPLQTTTTLLNPLSHAISILPAGGVGPATTVQRASRQPSRSRCRLSIAGLISKC